MNLRFWQMLSRRSRSTRSSISASSASAGESIAVPDSINRLARSADRLSLAAEIAACIVVIGIILEDWDKFATLVSYPSLISLRNALAPIMVAGGIAFEILFSRLSSGKERTIRNWYGLRVAELNLKAEQEHTARVKLETRIAGRVLTPEQSKVLILRMREFVGHRVYIGWCVETFEAEMFSVLMETTLKMAGLNANRVKVNKRTMPPGVFLYPARNKESERVAGSLSQALCEIDILATSFPPDNSSWVKSFCPEYQNLWTPDGEMVLIVVSENSLMSPPSKV